MKKRILFLLLLSGILFTQLPAQNVQIPTTGKPQSPMPELKPLQPADLVITNCKIVNAQFKDSIKGWVIKTMITVKNTGGFPTTSTDLKPFVKQTGSGSWKYTGTLGILIGLNPGESITKEYVFADMQKILPRGCTFSFKVQTDTQNKVIESNEANNETAVLVVPPAQ